jgi:N-acetylglutamate synthase-like GNAT family acetyltransferase
MCAQAAMPTPKDYLAGTVAVNDKDQPVGYIRVLLIEDDLNPKGLGAYIYPVVVFEGWRQYGIASALVDYELERHGALKLVACKASRGFYQRTGWETEDWDNIAALISRDCELCPDCQTCDPQPFRKSQA